MNLFRTCFRVSALLVIYISSTHSLLASEDKALPNDADQTARLEQRIEQLEAALIQLRADIAAQKQASTTTVMASANIEPRIKATETQIVEHSLTLDDHQYLLEESADLDNHSMQIAGYADVEYKGSNEPGINEEFRMHHLSLFFTRQFNDSFKFFSEIEYEDAPKFDGVNDGTGDIEEASGTIFVEAMNFDWNHSEQLNLRAGRFFTPAGIWSEDHYPPFVSTQERPMHIFKIFPQFVDGISVYGTTLFDNNISFDYTAFLGNGESIVSGKKDLNSNKGVGMRGTFHFPILDEITTGFTYYRDNADSSNDDGKKNAYGLHARLRHNKLSAQLEYAKADLSFNSPILDYTTEGFYAQFTYELNDWAMGYRYDTLDSDAAGAFKVDRQSIFLNYHLNQNITLKSEYHINQYDLFDKDDFGYYLFSISAYLGR